MHRCRVVVARRSLIVSIACAAVVFATAGAGNATTKTPTPVNTLRSFAFTAGSFYRPFGYEVLHSHSIIETPEFSRAERFDFSVYHNINSNEDVAFAEEESKRFLDLYYVPTEFSLQEVRDWVAIGSPEQCVQHLQRLADMGVTEVTLRITSCLENADACHSER